MKQIFSLFALILLIFSCQESSKSAAGGDDSADLQQINDGPFDLNKISKHWTELNILYGDSVVLSSEDDNYLGYRFEEDELGWQLIKETKYEAYKLPILSAKMVEGDLLIETDPNSLGYSESEEMIIRILNFEDGDKPLVWQISESDDRIFVNNNGVDNYEIIRDHCYDYTDYCPNENPNIGIVLEIPQDQLILPGRSLGLLTHLTDESQLNEIYKGSQIETDKSNPNWLINHVQIESNNNISIIWNKNTQQPYSATISGEKSAFKTKEGIGIGSSIHDVETAFWSLFYIYGFEIDQEIAGQLVKWNNPEHNEIQFKFKVTNDLPQEEYEQIMGSDLLASNHYLLRKAGLVVEEITVFFADPANVGETLFNMNDLVIYDNKAYYKENELYDGTRKLLHLIEEEQTDECPVVYTYDYNPLSLVGAVFSYELNEYGEFACGYSGQMIKIKTIDYITQKTLNIDDVFTESSIIEALKNDSWIQKQAEEYSVDLSSFESVDDYITFMRDLEINIEKESFAIKKFKNNENLAEVQLIGFQSSPPNKIILGLELEPKVKDFAKNSSFFLGEYNSFISPKK